jgi:hypothetical protein
MRKVFYPNKLVHKSEEGFYRNQATQKHKEKVERNKKKFEELLAHYNGLLSDMVQVAMDKISPELSPEEIEEICFAGEVSWKKICANVRATSFVIRLKNETFRDCLIQSLVKKYPQAVDTKPEA